MDRDRHQSGAHHREYPAIGIQIGREQRRDHEEHDGHRREFELEVGIREGPALYGHRVIVEVDHIPARARVDQHDGCGDEEHRGDEERCHPEA